MTPHVPQRDSIAGTRWTPGLWTLLAAILPVIWYINPVREMMTADDGWAYALTVRYLLETGQYRLHDWAAANMPVQIYLGAFLTRVFGYSFTVLRLSTLSLLVTGLISLYFLLRDFGTKDAESALLALAVFASPPVLFLSFTFQTDVQFLGCQILALWLYTRALRTYNYALMVLASLAAVAAVGTRQFGEAMIAGLFATWLFCEQDRLRKLPLYVVGLIPPLVAALWQFHLGASQPTFSQKVRLSEQLEYLRHVPTLAADILWRPVAVVQYLSLFLLPLAPVLFVEVRGALGKTIAFRDEDFTAPRDRSRLHWWLLIGCFGYIAAEIGYEYFHRRDVLVPFLDWLLRPGGVLEPLLPSAFGKRLGLTILTDVFAVILGWCLVRRYFRPMSRHELERGEWFVLLCGLAALALQTLYVQFYDVYLIQFLPFAVFALGRASREWPTWCKVSTGVLCAVMLCISSLWTRGNLEQAKASWQAAEVARSAGGLPEDIAGNMTWSCYNGAFDAWIRSIGGLDATANYSGDNRMHAAFFSFLGQRFERANYSVSSSHPHTGKKAWKEFGQFEYRDKRLQPRTIYLLGRVTSE